KDNTQFKQLGLTFKFNKTIMKKHELFIIIVIPLAIFLAFYTKKSIIADTIYLDGKIYTVNSEQKWAEAFAVKDGRFIKVGTNIEVQKLKGKATEVVDLRGHIVLPGLIDDHMHPDVAAENLANISFDSDNTSYEEFIVLIKRYLNENPDCKWVIGGSIDYLWDDGSNIKAFEKPSNKSILDAIISDKPAFFWEVSGHAALVNTKALELLNITKDTPDPKGGHFVKDKDGELTGILRESAANVVYEEYLKHLPKTNVLAEKWIKPVFSYLNSLGITSVTDVGGRESYIKAYNHMDKNNQLSLRLAIYPMDPVYWETEFMKKKAIKPIQNPELYTTDRVDIVGVKFILDGAAAGQTAVMIDPYVGSDDYRGPWRLNPEYFIQKVVEYDKKGLMIKAHAAGDGATRLVLDAVEEARKNNNTNIRHSVAHTSLVHPNDMHRFKELGVHAEFSPIFWYQMAAIDVVEKDIGPERKSTIYSIKSLIDNGVSASFGSDWIVTPPNPWPAIETLVTRRAPGFTKGAKLNDANAITLEQAIYGYTLGGAYARNKEKELGSIELGKHADFIIIDQNIFEIPIHKVHKTKVLNTVVGGENVYVHEKVQELIDLGQISGQFGGHDFSEQALLKMK
ncbi:MAG: amidohydrolase, partial [Bacteroidales bacterium]|nr:amidohydrolase [Bacteroidales bacterium]